MRVLQGGCTVRLKLAPLSGLLASRKNVFAVAAPVADLSPYWYLDRII